MVSSVLSSVRRPLVPTNTPSDSPVPPQLLHHNTTTVNQVLGLPGMFSTFNSNQLMRLRAVAITSSCLSLVFGIIGIYCLINIDRRRKVFRHDLLFFLIVCGFIKALVLMIYPVVILIKNSVYFNPNFFNILGWCTAYTVEGSDLAIFFFAVHFALLIFRPSHKWRNKRTGNLEGGLYRARALLWPLTGSMPLLLASLAFINFTTINEGKVLDETTVILYNQNYNDTYFAKIGGYKPYSAWCYLPPYPLWYKLVLSWGPRYFLIIFILTMYATIYWFVLKESRTIKRELGEFKHNRVVNDGRRRMSVLESAGRLFFFKRPRIIMGCFRSIRNFILSRKDKGEQEKDGRESIPQEYGMRLSHLKSMEGPPNGEVHSTDNPASSGCTGNVIGEPSTPSLAEMNTIALQSIHAGLMYQENPSPSASAPDSDYLSNQSIVECCDEEEAFGGQRDLYEALSTRPNPRNDSISLESAARVHTLDFQDEDVDNHNGLRPTSFRLGVSSIQTLFRPLTGKSTNSQRSSLRQDAKKQEVHNVQADFQRQTYAEMKRRRLQIQKNVTLIFIYPFSYIAIWIFPLVVDITQYKYEIDNGPVIWLAYIATIVQPLNCFADTLIFLFKERPWRYSWREVHTKELMDSYALKGELGENEAMELCDSDWGRKGWYYRGSFEKKDCWRHQPQKWKRAVWYIYRFFKGLMSNKCNFEDNCDDKDYWNRYYFADPGPRSSSGQKHISSQKERQFSFPSDSTTLSDSANNNNNNNNQNNQNNQNNVVRPDSVADVSSYRKVSLFWKVIHFLPMLEAIDLDELNHKLLLRTKYDDFVLPGLQLALQNNPKVVNGMRQDSSLFKPDYSLSDRTQDFNSPHSRERHPKNHRDDSSNYNRAGGSATVNMDFSDVVAENAQSRTHKKFSVGMASHDDSVDMLSFLKGP